MVERIGIVGTGRMGANIARRMHDCGCAVAAVLDRDVQSARSLGDEIGAEVPSTLEALTAACDIIFTVVSDDDAMGVIFAEHGDSLLLGARGRIFVNCATLTPGVHVEVARRCESRGAQALEACVASSIPQARNGTLYLMCAGKREVFDALRPLLERLSSTLRYLGPAGTAAQMKALVNMVMNVNTAGLAEGLALAEALGLDLDTVRQVFAQTGAASRVLETDGADMQNREHEVYFSAEHAAKDSGIALALGREHGLALPLAQATFDQYEKMKRLGLGSIDKSGISELTFRSRSKEVVDG